MALHKLTLSSNAFLHCIHSNADAVHRPKIHPIKEIYEQDDKIACTAKGNPVPDVTFSPEFPGSERGSGWATLVVREEWAGRQIQGRCTASNRLDGMEHVESQNLSISVSGEHFPGRNSLQKILFQTFRLFLNCNL